MAEIKTPNVTITAFGSGRKISLTQIKSPAVLIFHGRGNSDASEVVNTSVRDKYPKASSVLVATIMDLHIAPRLLRGVVEAFIDNAYNEACKKLPKGWTPREYLLLLPDWDGKLTKSFGIQNSDHTAGVAVLDSAGKIVGIYQGKNLAAECMALLAKINGEIK